MENKLAETYKINLSAKALGLFLLRVLIGWHLLYEGLIKLTDPAWSAAGFLKASQGPFSWFFLFVANNKAWLGIVEVINEWGLTIIGALLMVGLFTRVTAYAGMLLLLTYYLCTPPLAGLSYTAPSEGNYLVVNKTLIEAVALLIVALFSKENDLGLDILFKRQPDRGLPGGQGRQTNSFSQ